MPTVSEDVAPPSGCASLSPARPLGPHRSYQYVPVRTSVVRAVVKFVLAALVIIVVVHVPRRDPIESEVVIKSEHRTGVSVNGMDGVARYTCTAVRE